VRAERLMGGSGSWYGGSGIEDDPTAGSSNNESSADSPNKGSAYVHPVGNCLSGCQGFLGLTSSLGVL